MLQLALHCRQESGTEVCALCSKAIQMAAGQQIRALNNLEPVCADCAGLNAPSLAALVNLARTAERITRIGRQSVFPPLSALLDLASAAEKYSSAMGTVGPLQH